MDAFIPLTHGRIECDRGHQLYSTHFSRRTDRERRYEAFDVSRATATNVPEPFVTIQAKISYFL